MGAATRSDDNVTRVLSKKRLGLNSFKYILFNSEELAFISGLGCLWVKILAFH